MGCAKKIGTKYAALVVLLTATLLICIYYRLNNSDEVESEGQAGASSTTGPELYFRTLEAATEKSAERKQNRLFEEWLEHIESCVPHYKLLHQHMNLRTGDRKWKATSLSLIASYDYDNYSVVTIEADGWFGRTMYCRYFDESYKEIIPPIRSFVFPEFAVHCCSYAGTRYMSVSESSTQPINEFVPVIDRRSDEPEYFLSLCLAPMYGNERKWLLLVELVEHYKMHGVEHFYIYVKDMDSYTEKLIKYYEEHGIAEVIVFRKYNDRPGKEWQLVGTEDCLQRSRHHSRYVIFQDLDERIVTPEDLTVRKLIEEEMKIANRTAMVSFSSQRIERIHHPPLVYEGSHVLEQQLPLFAFHKAIKNVWHLNPPKCAVDPKGVLLMWVHHVELYFPGYTYHSVARKKAILRHYRDLTHAPLLRRLRLIFRLFSYEDVGYPPKLAATLFRNIRIVLNDVYSPHPSEYKSKKCIRESIRKTE